MLKKSSKKSLLFSLALVMVAVGLSGCDKAKQVMGLKRHTPDEFGVLNRAPLSAPPGLGLKPPTPGTERPQDAAPQKKARAALLKQDQALPVKTSGQLSASENYLLKSTGVDQRDAEIRKVVDHEAAVDKPDKAFIQKVLFWQKKKKNGEVVDPQEEHKRLHGDDHPTTQLK